MQFRYYGTGLWSPIDLFCSNHSDFDNSIQFICLLKSLKPLENTREGGNVFRHLLSFQKQHSEIDF